MAGPIALLVVHGIGAQQRGEAVGRLAHGLHLLDPAFDPQDASDGITATVGGQPVRLYEVYWADLLQGDVTHGTFQMAELQSLSWFPWFNLHRGNYRPASYSRLKVAWWVLALPLVNFLVLWAYYGAGLVVESVSGVRSGRRGARSEGLSVLDRLLDEYAGDVINYVNSAGQAFHREASEPPVPDAVRSVFPQIVQRFRDQLVKAAADGCESIQIVAHSLGSVVTYHALAEFGRQAGAPDEDAVRAALPRVHRLYTIGSPLEKIRFFWPRLTPWRTATAGAIRWDNFVSFFDPVSGPLRTFRDWGPVTNHRLLGGGFFSGHVVYERSPVFLRALGQGLAGRPIAYRRTTIQWMGDLITLAGESVAAPLALLVTLVIGLALFAVVALLIPELLSWTLGWFVPADRLAPVTDTLSYIFLGLMVLTFLVAPCSRASLVHARYWSTDPDERSTRAEV